MTFLVFCQVLLALSEGYSECMTPEVASVIDTTDVAASTITGGITAVLSADGSSLIILPEADILNTDNGQLNEADILNTNNRQFNDVQILPEANILNTDNGQSNNTGNNIVSVQNTIQNITDNYVVVHPHSTTQTTNIVCPEQCTVEQNLRIIVRTSDNTEPVTCLQLDNSNYGNQSHDNPDNENKSSTTCHNSDQSKPKTQEYLLTALQSSSTKTVRQVEEADADLPIPILFQVLTDEGAIKSVNMNQPAESEENIKTDDGDNIEKSDGDMTMVDVACEDDSKPIKCDLCSSSFSRLGNYTRHRMIHTVNSKVGYIFHLVTHSEARQSHSSCHTF